MAAILAGAWRAAPPPLPAPVAAACTPGLLRARAGALAWWRLRHSGLADTPAAGPLREAYHLHGLEAALAGRDLARAVARLRAAGIEPVLVKGPAVARLYPDRALRPFSDLDLCVAPDQAAAAAAALVGWPEDAVPLDVHAGFAGLDPGGWEELGARTDAVRLGGVTVRVPGPEDHLRMLALHLMRHGVAGPLWLCDLAVAVESRPAGFDWDRCLGSDRRRADWVACAIGLGHQLLGVDVHDTPVAARARRLPGWLVPGVLQHWDRAFGAEIRPRASARGWRALGDLPEVVRRHWPNATAATFHLGGPLNDFPRPPLQLADAVARLVRFGWRRTRGRSRPARV
jgi:hypothetical protein